MADDYTDLIMPIDYTPDAFQYANRKRYDKWKMIGMQFSHPYFKGINTLGSGNINTLGPLQGVVSGCRPIEEINQHNHIIGRGGWYLRARRDGDGNNSATYGIVGHCHQPDARSEIAGQYDGVFTQPYENAGNDPVWQSLAYSPFDRNWGFPMDYNLCSCSSDVNFKWVMGAFIETYDGTTGKKVYSHQGIFVDLEKATSSMESSARALVSQGPGVFSAYVDLGGGNVKNYRTCEAFLSDLYPVTYDYHADGTLRDRIGDPVDLCLQYNSAVFTQGATPARTGVPVIHIDQLSHGVIVKLTSLPSCAHFDKIKIDRIPCSGEGTWKDDPVAEEKRDICCNTEYIGYNPNDPICFQGTRCERAVIRIMPACEVYLYGPRFGKSDNYTYSKQFKTIEKHFDRWDRVIGDRTLYKIFDEVFDLPDAGMRVRVITHNGKEMEKHFSEMTYQELVYDADGSPRYATRYKPECMEKHYLTGGQPGNGPTGSKGCSCIPSEQDENKYPIRPYNEFVYCPNNFSCDKTC